VLTAADVSLSTVAAAASAPGSLLKKNMQVTLA